MKKKILSCAVILSVVLQGMVSIPAQAADGGTSVKIRTDMTVYSTPYKSNSYVIAKKGEILVNYGLDFDDGDSDYDHVYRKKTGRHGYVNHHHW